MSMNVDELKKHVESIIYTSFWNTDQKNIYISSFTEDYMQDKLVENKLNKTDEFKNNIWLVIPKDCVKNEMIACGTDVKLKLYPAVFRRKLLLISDPELINCFAKLGATINNGNLGNKKNNARK